MPIFGAVLLEKSVIWVYSILTFWLTHFPYVHPFLCGIIFHQNDHPSLFDYLTVVCSKHIFRNLQPLHKRCACFGKEAEFSKVGKQKADKM